MNPFDSPITTNHREHLRGELKNLPVNGTLPIDIPACKNYNQTKVAVFAASKNLGFKITIRKSENTIWVKRVS